MGVGEENVVKRGERGEGEGEEDILSIDCSPPAPQTTTIKQTKKSSSYILLSLQEPPVHYRYRPSTVGLTVGSNQPQ